MSAARDTHVVLAGSGAGARAELISALRAEGWHVSVVEDLQECAAAAAAGTRDVVVVVCPDPDRLPRQPVRCLMNLRADMSIMFLVGDAWTPSGMGGLAGATSGQIHRLSCPVAEFMKILKEDILSVLRGRAQYSIICVDDDPEFLASVRGFLPANLRAALPRFELDFEFFEDPLEALACCERAGDQLAAVVSDQIMPRLSGIDLLTRVKNFYPDVKRVLMTGHAGLDSAVTAINQRILDKYMFKPVDPVDFTESIRLLLSEHHLRLRAQAHQHRIMAQFEYIRAVTAAEDPGDVLRSTLDFLCEQVYPIHALVALMQDGQLCLRAANTRVPGCSLNAPLPAEDGLRRWLGRHLRPFRAARPEDLPQDVRLQLPLPMAMVPLVRQQSILGVILVAGRQGGRPFSREEGMLLEFVGDMASVAIDSFHDRELVERSYVNTLASLMETVEARDSYTRGHTERVCELAVKLAVSVGISGPMLQAIERAALLHDIGKIALPDGILLKPGLLTEQETAAVRAHPARADRILQHLKYLDNARTIIRSHHECYDGQGYPDGLAGEEVPIGARILAIADSYDAMTSARPYRDAVSPEVALAEIAAKAASQFDPRLVAAFLAIMRPGVSELAAASFRGGRFGAEKSAGETNIRSHLH